MMGESARRLSIIFALAAALLSGCATAPRPVQIVGLEASVTHFAGNALSGPLEEKVPPIQPADALSVSTRFFALTKIPPAIDEPLGPRLRLIVSSLADCSREYALLP